MRCRQDSDCVAVPSAHCAYTALNRRAARQSRYRTSICAGRGEGACGHGQPEARCTAGCCEASPQGLGGF
ncbi:MAG: hypothetical protein JJ863_22220 [Deltaproteobacteria bacterium]|nr:hypothetical protein [Deltaproteobacteria bacterium]